MRRLRTALPIALASVALLATACGDDGGGPCEPAACRLRCETEGRITGSCVAGWCVCLGDEVDADAAVDVPDDVPADETTAEAEAEADTEAGDEGEGFDADAAEDGDGSTFCWPGAEGLVDCDQLAAECELPVGSSCGVDVYPVNCCEGRASSNVTGTLLTTALEPFTTAWIRLGRFDVDATTCAIGSWTIDLTTAPTGTPDAAGAFDVAATSGAPLACHYALVVATSDVDYVAVTVAVDSDSWVPITPPADASLAVGTIVCEPSPLDCYLSR